MCRLVYIIHYTVIHNLTVYIFRRLVSASSKPSSGIFFLNNLQWTFMRSHPLQDVWQNTKKNHKRPWEKSYCKVVYNCILNNIYWLNNTTGMNHLKIKSCWLIVKSGYTCITISSVIKFCLIFVYWKTLSITQCIWRQIMRWLLSNELDRMWKETVAD
jgi:hypothetical protein